MGKIHERFKARKERIHTVDVDTRIIARVRSMTAKQQQSMAQRLSVFMQDLDQARTVRYLDAAARHHTMQRLADEAKSLGLKGHWNLLCNRTQCLRTPATFYNRGSYAFYCSDCARELNRVNARDANFDGPFGEGKGELCRGISTAEEAAKLHVMP